MGGRGRQRTAACAARIGSHHQGHASTVATVVAEQLLVLGETIGSYVSTSMPMRAAAALAIDPTGHTPARPPAFTHTQTASKVANPLIPSNVTGAFTFASPRPGNFSSLLVDATNTTGGHVACSLPVCTPAALSAPNSTATCSYLCAPGAVSVRPVVAMDGVNFTGAWHNVSVATVTDPASNCVNVSVPLFTSYGVGGTWTGVWRPCANGATKTAIISIPIPAPADCPTFWDVYVATANATALPGAGAGMLLAVGAGNVTLPCSPPSVAGDAGFSVTSSYNW